MRITIALAAVGLLVAPVLADWDPNDPFKMHFPQMPDPYGWDVDVTFANLLADDWQCSASGLVDDVHFWYSWWQDQVGVISMIHASIHADIPDPDGSGPAFSMPGAVLWQRNFYPNEFVTRWYGSGDQGFLGFGEPQQHDHVNYYQCNIVDIPDPFYQTAGTIYWLDLSIVINDPVGTHIGWKTSLDHWNDDAVRWGANGWEELLDPYTGASLDLAFVITPEPTSLLVLGVGALLLLRRR